MRVRRTNTYLGERYRRLKKRRGSKRAALAVGQSMLVIYYQMMTTGQEYHEKEEEFSGRQIVTRWSVSSPTGKARPGYQVTRQPQPAT